MIRKTPEDYRAELCNLIKKDIPMICANPDIQVERGDRVLYCAGALGQLYTSLGGKVHYAGKPHSPIYEEALRKLENIQGKINLDKILCIGDGVNTDILGAEKP